MRPRPRLPLSQMRLRTPPERSADVAKDVGQKVAGTARDVADKVGETAKDVRERGESAVQRTIR